MDTTLKILALEFPGAIRDTFIMVGIAMLSSVIIGSLLGFFLFLTSNPLFYKNRALNLISSLIINVIRSLPFLILMLLLIPFAMLVTGTVVGPIAASVSLSIASIAFFARLLENALSELDKGVIEAAISSGASIRLIITDVIMPELLPGLIRAATVTFISVIGYSAMSGTVGGGGIGALAINYGYYRYELGIMIIMVIILIVIVQGAQFIGDKLASLFAKD